MDAPEWAAMACAGKARRRRGLTAREEEQRGQRAPGRLNRVCSALTSLVILAVGKILNGHSAMQAVNSGQLRFLGVGFHVIMYPFVAGHCFVLGT